MNRNSLDLLNDIAQVLYDKNGINILALDVQGLSSITDYLIIAEGNVGRHAIAMAKGIIEDLKEKGENPIHVEGLQTGDWIVIDYPQIMVHIFTQGLREKYSLERLWPESKLIDLNIDVSKKAMG